MMNPMMKMSHARAQSTFNLFAALAVVTKAGDETETMNGTRKLTPIGRIQQTTDKCRFNKKPKAVDLHVYL